MSGDIRIRKEGRAGRITLDRPKALNALTWDMVRAIDAALEDWRLDASVDLLVIDAAGDRAFCAGGDIQEMYERGRAGDFAYGERFWRDEYRMNARLFRFPKPVVTLMQGFTMGGGVGVGCHGSHRVLGESAQVSMPECGIGLVPDVGGSLILARAPGRLGDYLGLTADRMEAGDAIYAGFADYLVPEADWPALVSELCKTGDEAAVDRASRPGPEARLGGWQNIIDDCFGPGTLTEIGARLEADGSEIATKALEAMRRNSPLSMAVTLEIIAAVRKADTIEAALDHECRFTSRSMEHGDFIEGIRAAVVDRDRSPTWRHGDWDVPAADVARMRAPVTPPLEL